MGGFECADHLNAFGNRVDMTKLTGHDYRLDEDYKNLRQLNIATVREGIRWSKVEYAPYQYDWSSVDKMMEAAQENGIQIIWDICHFGFPDDITPLHPMFARRFGFLCENFVRH
ncbi:beta-galactosidase, partial [Chryseobacterium sp.]|uniref:beta-galactosidase n=1 Tax=Chryseobacterium sp. TaxID=1871047 RepID=UPI0028A187FE